MFNKKIILALILCSVFAVGTLYFADTVDAAQWKKYDSGKFKDEYPAAGHKKVSSYQSYTKGTNNLYVNIYGHSKNGNKKLTNKLTLNKKGNIIKITEKNYFSNEKETFYYQTKWSVKKVYKNFMKESIKINGIPPKKVAFDKQSFTVKKNSFKAYGIKHNNYYISGYIYKNNEEYCSFTIANENNKYIYKEYNQKRKLTSKETFTSTQSITSIYKIRSDKIINKIKSS